MILDCPACRARFMVADGLIPAAGRIVRCGKCTHEWFVEPPRRDPIDVLQDLAIPSPEPEIAETITGPEPISPSRFRANLPTVQKRKLSPKPFKIAAPLLAATWLALAFVAYFPSWSKTSALAGIYKALGTEPTDGLVFADVQMEREQEGNKTRFVLSGNIRNHSSATRKVPTVRVELKDKANKSLWSREYPVNAELKAGDIYPFRIPNVETTFAKSVTSIVVDMGGKLELLVR